MLGGGTGCGDGGVGDSARAETSARTSWRDRASKETRRSGDEAVPRISPGSRSWYPVKGMNCRPEETNVPRGMKRRSRVVSQPCNNPLGQGIHRGGLGSPE